MNNRECSYPADHPLLQRSRRRGHEVVAPARLRHRRAAEVQAGGERRGGDTRPHEPNHGGQDTARPPGWHARGGGARFLSAADMSWTREVRTGEEGGAYCCCCRDESPLDLVWVFQERGVLSEHYGRSTHWTFHSVYCEIGQRHTRIRRPAVRTPVQADLFVGWVPCWMQFATRRPLRTCTSFTPGKSGPGRRRTLAAQPIVQMLGAHTNLNLTGWTLETGEPRQDRCGPLLCRPRCCVFSSSSLLLLCLCVCISCGCSGGRSAVPVG